MQNKLTIIGGQWRSRKISFEEVEGLRPTPNRVRETLFNWLQYDIVASCCLDLYAGSGALSFEAASRGAKRVLQIENHPTTCRYLKSNATLLNATQIQLIQSDVLQFLKQNNETFDIVFLDPPFHLDLAAKTCVLLEQTGALKSFAKIYVETESVSQSPENAKKKQVFQLTGIPENWRLLKQKTAGDVMYHLFERTEQPNNRD